MHFLVYRSINFGYTIQQPMILTHRFPATCGNFNSGSHILFTSFLGIFHIKHLSYCMDQLFVVLFNHCLSQHILQFDVTQLARTVSYQIIKVYLADLQFHSNVMGYHIQLFEHAIIVLRFPWHSSGARFTLSPSP